MRNALRRPLLLSLMALALLGCQPAGQPMPTQIPAETLAHLLDGHLLPAKTGGTREFWLERDGALHVLDLREVVVTGPDEVAVLTRSMNAERQDGEVVPLAGHSEGGGVDLHYLRWDGQHWSLVSSELSGFQVGSFGEFGKTRVVDLGGGLKGVLIHAGGTWQGYSVEMADLVPLDRTSPRSILNLHTGSSNEGACSLEKDCWDGTSRIEFIPGRLPEAKPEVQLHQTLKTEPSPLDARSLQGLDEDAKEALMTRLEQSPPARQVRTRHATLLYQWKDGRYQLKAGKSILPEV